MSSRNMKAQQMRLRLAQEAAQILLQSGSRDYYAAKQKAAVHLGAADTRNMPSNTEIESALQEYQRIFRADSQPAELLRLRKAALHAMQFFKDFKPRLVGSVLRGTADKHSAVSLHIVAATVEDVDLFLMHYNIPFEIGEKRVRFQAEQVQSLPVYRFVADDAPIDVVIFPLDGPRQPPLSPLDSKPMQRADIHKLEKLLQEEQGSAAL
ncbi:FIG00856772: hypothetical protein [hydrothermal vent metagenome]|uniref:Nucleotidyltransferase n=1 Tax=hydrothermal vent metagenome TaxID=652676 RepID=A0A3B1BE12_9ZZZZ